MRKTLFLLALAAAPLGAQAVTKDAPDPDKNVAGGALPAGWTGRTDRANQTLANAKFAAMDGGFRVTTGPAAIFWNPANQAVGTYTLRATFTQSTPSTHPEAYGVIFGGKNLDAPNQDYMYFLVRQNGQYMIKHRAGSETHTIQDWTAHPAIQSVAAGGAPAVNTLEVAVGDANVSYKVNGQEVKSFPKSGQGTNGLYGLRVNHNLDVQVTSFGVNR
jgi:hypothetical protein